MKKKTGNIVSKIVPIITFIILMFLSYFIIKHMESLFIEKQSFEMIKISEDLSTKIYSETMKDFSKIIVLKAAIENSPSFELNGPFSSSFFDTPSVKRIFYAPNGIISSVYPLNGNRKLIGVDLTKNFYENISLPSLERQSTAMIIGPYEIETGEYRCAAIAPVFKRGPEGVPKFVGVCAVESDFMQLLEKIDYQSINKQGFAFKIWRFTNSNTTPVTVLSSSIPINDKHTKHSVTFTKSYFTTNWYYTISPLHKYYKTMAFKIEAFVLLFVGILLSWASYIIVCYLQNQEKRKLFDVQTELLKTQEHIIYSLSNLVENRDSDTGNHVKRTSSYVVLIAEKARSKGLYEDILTDKFIETLGKAAPMHDIGKIVVSDVILKKPGKLTPEEFDEIKKHTTEGGRIIEDIIKPVQDEFFTTMAYEIAIGHHEKWDGTGYPNKVAGDNIPLSARIMALADVFDALTSPRCYKAPFTFEKALSIIEEGKGTQFDPKLTDLFIACQKDIHELLVLYAD